MNIKQLISKECANYFPDSGASGKIKDYCCYKDKTCVFFESNELSVRCKYFENAVLSLNPDLQFQYRKERQLGTIELMRTCKRCLQSFAGNAKQKYCEDCITIRRREQSRLRMQKKRKAS